MNLFFRRWLQYIRKGILASKNFCFHSLPDHTRLDQKFFLRTKKRHHSLRQLLYVKKVLSQKEWNVFRASMGIIVLSLLTLLGNYYFTHWKPVPTNGGEYTEGLVGSPQFLNPLLAQTNDVDRDLTSLIFSGLFSLKNFSLTPDLVKEYSISEDQKTYSFTLRNGILWHDGEPLLTDDIIFTFEKILDPDFKSALRMSFEGVKIEKTDDTHFVITLEKPFAPFIYSLTFGILPKHIWEDIPSTTAYLSEYNLLPIGSGPWRVAGRSIDKKRGIIQSYKLAPNEYFYQKHPFLDTLNFVFFDTISLAVDALKNREVQGLGFLPKQYQNDTIIEDRVEYHELNLAQYTALFFNQKKNEALKEKEVRLALAYGVNKQRIVRETLDDQAEILNGPIPKGFVGYNPDIEQLRYDAEKANTLLDNAKWEKIAKEKYVNLLKEKNTELTEEESNALPEFVRRKNGKNLEITITTVDKELNRAVVSLVEENWKRLGVIIKTRFILVKDIRKDVIQPREYEVFLYGNSLGQDPDPYPFWHSSQNAYPGLNLAIFADKDVDKLLEEARATGDTRSRQAKYQHFQNILVAQLPAIFLYNPIYVYPVDKNIHGFTIEKISVPSDRFANVTEWYRKTKRERIR